MDKTLDEFLKDVPREEGEEKTIDDVLNNTSKEDKENADDLPGEDRKERRTLVNREIKRLKQQLEEASEITSELNNRVKELSERKSPLSDEWKNEVARIYGTNTPEGQEATKLLQNALEGMEERAVQRALIQLQEQQEELSAREKAELSEANTEIDSLLGEVEGEFGIDMTSSTKIAEARRQQFFTMMEKYSPKRNGKITEYADPIAIWEQVENTMKSKQTSRAKEIADRSMRTDTSSMMKVDDSETVRALRQAGIL